jgi:hypothetical protein
MFGSWAQRQAFTSLAQPRTLCGSYDGQRLFINCQTIGSGIEQLESSNYGVSWASTGYCNGYILASGSNADRRIYYSFDSNTLEYTLDNGVTFSTLMANAQPNNSLSKPIAVSYSLSTIYYLQSSSVYASHDMGVTWNPLTNLGYFSTSKSIACSSNGQYVGFVGLDDEGVDPGFGTTIYTSSDYGSNWVSLSSSNPGKPLYLDTRQDLQSVSISGDGSTVFVGAFQGQLNTSRDFGSTFKTASFSNLIPQLSYFTASAINSNGDSILAGANNSAGDQSYVVQSETGGSSWSIAVKVNDDWKNVFLSQDGNTKVAAASNLYSFGSLTSNFSNFDLATSMTILQPSWSYKMTMPDATPYQGKQITFIKPSAYSNHQIQLLSQQSTVIHTLSNTFAQLTAVSSNWVLLGNDSGYYSNDSYSQRITASMYTNLPPFSCNYPTYGYTGDLHNPKVITDLAVFPGIETSYELSSIQVLLPTQLSTATLEVSTLVFQGSLTTPLILSSGALLYNGVNYSQTIAGEILQTFTA